MNSKISKLVLLVSVLFCFGMTGSADGQEWARKMFTEFRHEFGTVTKKEQPVHKFVFKNHYEEDINIVGLMSSCGCTTATVSKRVLKKHETAEVVCRFNSHLFDGYKQATITVRFGGQFYGEVQLVVNGTIVNDVIMQPNSIDFGQVTTGTYPERVIQVSTSGNPSFRITDIKSTYEHIAVQYRQRYRTPQQVGYEVKATLKPSAPKGFSQGQLYLICEDQGRVVRHPINFNAKVVSALQVSPDLLTLARVKPGEEIKKRIMIKADAPFQIQDVLCKSKAFSVRQMTPDESRKLHMVDVTYTGEAAPGKKEWALDFVTSLGTGTSGSVKIIVDIVSEQAISTADKGSN